MRRELTSGYKCKFALISFRRPEKVGGSLFLRPSPFFARGRHYERPPRAVCSFFFLSRHLPSGPTFANGNSFLRFSIGQWRTVSLTPFRECKYELWRERRSSDRIKNLYGIRIQCRNREKQHNHGRTRTYWPSRNAKGDSIKSSEPLLILLEDKSAARPPQFRQINDGVSDTNV